MPLSLDVIDPDRSLDHVLRPYVIGLRKRIEKRWIPNVLSPKRSAKVYIMILQDGTISRVEITASSGDATFDETVIRAVQDSHPLPQIPIEVLNIEATFDNRFMSHEIVQTNLQRMQLRMSRGTATPNAYHQYNQPIQHAFTRNVPEMQSSFQQPRQHRDDHETEWSNESNNSEARAPEVSPNPIELNGRSRYEGNERSEDNYPPDGNQFEHPLNSAQFRQLSDDQKREYKSWLLNVWLKTPMAEDLRVKVTLRKVSPRK